MSHRPREDEPSVIDLGSRRPRGSSGRRHPDDARERIIRGLRVIKGGGDPDEIQRRLAKGKIVRALGEVLVDGQLPDGVEDAKE